MTHSIPTEASQDASEKLKPEEEVGGKHVDTLNLALMLEKINAIVCSDWAYTVTDDMVILDEDHPESNFKQFTQEQAEEMSTALGKIYMIAHCIRCTSCGSKYRVTDMKPSDSEANTEVPLSRPEAHQDDAVLAARLEELDYIRMQPKDSIWGMIAERKASLLRQKESQS